MKGPWIACWGIIGMTLFFACREKEEVPLLDEDKVVKVLADAHLAEIMLQSVPAWDRDSIGHVYYRMIYRTHGVDQKDFEQTMKVLREDPVRLETIYEKVLEVLQELSPEELPTGH